MLIVAAIGSVNALFLATLFFKNIKPNRIANRLAGLLFLLIAIRLGKVLAQASDLAMLKSVYFNLMHGAFLAMGPVLYFYTKTLKARISWKPTWLLHLLPAILALTGASLIRSNTSLEFWIRVYEVMLILPLPYLILSGKTIARDTTSLKLSWPLKLQVMISAIWLLNGLFYWFDFPFYWVTGTLVTGMFYLFLLALKPGHFFSPEKYQNLRLDPEKSQQVFGELDKLLREEELYKKADLKLDQLSERLNLSVHLLSGTVNSVMGMGFPQYLHGLRIAAAKDLISKQPQSKIAAIAFEVGYQSLSTFNTAFKKQTGLTPSQFRLKNSEKTGV